MGPFPNSFFVANTERLRNKELLETIQNVGQECFNT